MIKTAPRHADDSTTDPEVRPLDRQQWADTGAPHTGIHRDLTGNSFRVVASGSSRIVTVGSVGDQVIVSGYHGEITGAETINLDAPPAVAPSSAQERLDLIVARLDTTSAPWKIKVRVLPGSPAPAGQAVAQPIVRDSSFWDARIAQVLIRGTAQVSQGDVTDLREWAVSGVETVGVISNSPYIGKRTARGTALWRRTFISGQPAWLIDNNNRMAGVGGALSGTAGDLNSTQWLEQAGTTVLTTDPSGVYRFFFPVPFPNGLLTFMCSNGDWLGTRAVDIFQAGGVHGPGDRTSVVVLARNRDDVLEPNTTVRMNYIAKGW